MKIQLLILTADSDYSNHLSRVLAEKHLDVFEISVCSSVERLKELLVSKVFDAALIGVELINDIDFAQIRLPLVLWDGVSFRGDESNIDNNVAGEEKKLIKKYQRISLIVSDILESYSQIAPTPGIPDSGRGRVTVVFSPSGGSGKTTVALAFASRMSLSGKTALYLSLEPFCSASAYFGAEGKSISKVFENLYSGNLEMLLQSFAQKDSETSIMYFREPENYDDLNELTEENVTKLISSLASNVDEVVVDIGSVCNVHAKTLLDMADKVLLVTDNSWSAKSKFRQFTEQHNTFEKIKTKTTIIANKGAKVAENRAAAIIELPLVQTTDGKIIFKTLSAKEY